jgi:hypothetical protein
MDEKYPIQWPEDFRRTMLKDRRERKQWKNTERQAIQALDLELKRFGAINPVITRRDPNDVVAPPDPSVAVWFSRKREDEDFSWQTALGIENPAPTRAEIETAFKRVAMKYHPDNQSGSADPAMYIKFDEHKRNALAYINRLTGSTRDFCIPCDNFKEAKWNITAIRMTIHSLRQMERDGTSGLVERAMKGFTAALPVGQGVGSGG